MENGYIALWRKLLQTSFYKDSYALHLAVHLMLRASHREHKIIFNNQELTIKQGELITGRANLSAETGINSATIYKKLKLLENIGFCNIKSNNRFSIISVCKYKDFQIEKNKQEQQEEQPRNNSVTTKEQPRNTYNKDNKGNKENIYADVFLSFYNDYPKKIAKPAAYKAWQKINPDSSLVVLIMGGLSKWKVSPDWLKDNGQYVPHPATWLNQRRWEDDVPAPIMSASQEADRERLKRDLKQAYQDRLALQEFLDGCEAENPRIPEIKSQITTITRRIDGIERRVK